jgi:hypothetical protein
MMRGGYSKVRFWILLLGALLVWFHLLVWFFSAIGSNLPQLKSAVVLLVIVILTPKQHLTAESFENRLPRGPKMPTEAEKRAVKEKLLNKASRLSPEQRSLLEKSLQSNQQEDEGRS